MPYMIVDFEGSSLGSKGYPIELAWSQLGTKKITSALIRPTPQWLEFGRWGPDAEKIHGIPRDKLMEEGNNHEIVATAFLDACKALIVLSDMPPADQHFMNELCGSRAPKLEDFWQTVRALSDRSLEGPACEEVEIAHPQRHRASADVRRLCFLWSIIVMRTPRPATSDL